MKSGPDNTPVPTCCVSQDGFVAATISPITTDPIPSTATLTDQCVDVRSCDECVSEAAEYCRYSNEGQPKCCVTGDNEQEMKKTSSSTYSVAHTTPIEHSTIPEWASDMDQCTIVKSC